MKARSIMSRRLGLSFITFFLVACSTAASTPSTPSAADAGVEDAALDAADASLAADAVAERDCTLSATDRDDAGFPLMEVDRSKLGGICWTPGAAEIAPCPSGHPCVAYRLPEDPPDTHRCGPGCDAVSCPGEHACMMTLSGLPSAHCDCW